MRYVLWAVLAFVALFGLLFFIAPLLNRMSKNRNRMTPGEVADVIEKFIDRLDGPWDWDDFICSPIYDDRLDVIRLRCEDLRDEFPADGAYCNEEGIEVLRGFVRELRDPRWPDHQVASDERATERA